MLIKEEPFIISEKGFLYSIWTNEFRVYEGKVLSTNRKSLDGLAFFCFARIRINCSLKPGEIYNSMVWLKERNDQFAIDIMIKYQEEQIKNLKRKIDNHSNKIILIQGGIKNE